MTSQRSASSPAPATRPRVEWVDAAKGISIALVVLFHATLVDTVPPTSGPWWAVNAVFAVLRMPLFFLAAGLFAAGVLRRSWPDLLRGRVLLLVWVYLLWLTGRRLLFALLGEDLELGARAYLLPQSEMWFLYVLAVFFVLGRALSRVPAAAQVAGAAVLAVMVEAADWEAHRFDDMATYLVFFLAGAHFSAHLRGWAARATWSRTVGLWALFLGASVGAFVTGLDEVPPTRVLLSVAALSAGVALAVVLAPGPLGRPLVALGRITLPIYVMHTLVIKAQVALAEQLGQDPQAALLGPPLLAVVAIATSVAAYSLLAPVPGLFDAPPALRRALGGAPADRSA